VEWGEKGAGSKEVDCIIYNRLPRYIQQSRRQGGVSYSKGGIDNCRHHIAFFGDLKVWG
jgi:hypothetical protein